MDKAKAVIRPSTRSKLETAYYERLEELRVARKIVAFQYEPVTFLLGHRIYYKPDFLIVTKQFEIELHEVKGSWKAKNQNAGRKGLKAAAARHPWFRFIAVTRDKEVGWLFEEISP
jgi:hypothetical protein